MNGGSIHDRPEVQAAMRAATAASVARRPGECAYGCGAPLDPVLVAEGRTAHQGCEFALVTERCRHTGWARGLFKAARPAPKGTLQAWHRERMNEQRR